MPHVRVSLQVPVRVHCRVQAASVLMLLAADVAAYVLRRASLQVAMAEAVTQAVLGGLLPTLLLQYAEHSSALSARTTRMRTAKKVC